MPAWLEAVTRFIVNFNCLYMVFTGLGLWGLVDWVWKKVDSKGFKAFGKKRPPLPRNYTGKWN